MQKTTLIWALFLAVALSACRTPSPTIYEPAAQSVPPVSFGHVALAVRNIESSALWYRDTLGFSQLGTVYNIDVGKSLLGSVAKALFGPDIKQLRISQLKTPDGIGIELFEFVDPAPVWTSNHPATGLLHFAVVASSFDDTLSRLERAGARRIIMNEANPSRRVAFFIDPDGNVIEIASSQWDGM